MDSRRLDRESAERFRDALERLSPSRKEEDSLASLGAGSAKVVRVLIMIAASCWCSFSFCFVSKGSVTSICEATILSIGVVSSVLEGFRGCLRTTGFE
jgi:hypothetical protein